MDLIKFEDGERFLICFEKTNSEWKQGIALTLFGKIKIKEDGYQDRLALWKNGIPKETVCTLYREKAKR